MATEVDPSLAATLLQQADAVIRGVIRKKLRVTLRAGDSREENLDALDLVGEVQLKLLSWMHKQGQDGQAILEFNAYAATVCYHTCADYLRAKYPQRTSLKNCLRRLLEKSNGYAVWTAANGEWMCGFAGWKASDPPANVNKIRHLQQSPDAIPEQALPRRASSSLPNSEWLRLLDAVFDATGGPVTMDDLLTVVAPLTGVEDVPQHEDWTGDEDEGSAVSVMDKTPARTPDAYSVRLTVERLQLYWGAILQLLPWHRAAYLLNLRDGDLDALPYYGVVSIEGIGEVIELKEKQMCTLEEKIGLGSGAGSRKRLGERFVACWKFLPLEDTIIACVLEVTRPQVIGYRNKARERLARSLKNLV